METSNLRPLTSHLQPQTSDFTKRPLTSHARTSQKMFTPQIVFTLSLHKEHSHSHLTRYITRMMHCQRIALEARRRENKKMTHRKQKDILH
jgi:hypothetical protein